MIALLIIRQFIYFILYPILVIPRLRFILQIILAYYGAIGRDPKFGSNIKTIAYLFLPLIALAIIPLIMFGMVIYSLGGPHGCRVDLRSWWDIPREEFRAFDQEIKDHISRVRQWQPEPLPARTKPYDINATPALKGIAAAVLLVLVGAPSLMLTMMIHAPRLLWRIFCNASWWDEFLTSVFICTVSAVIVIVGIPLVLFGSILFYLVVGFERGYREGIDGAYDHIMDDVDRMNEKLWEMGGPVVSN